PCSWPTMRHDCVLVSGTFNPTSHAYGVRESETVNMTDRSTQADKPVPRSILQAIGIIADVAAVSALFITGGRPLVWAASVGALLAGTYIMWRCWGRPVDKYVATAVLVATAGALVFGYSLGDQRQPASAAPSNNMPRTNSAAPTSTTSPAPATPSRATTSPAPIVEPTTSSV